MATETSFAAGLAGRYAIALYELADADRALDAVAKDLAALKTMIAESMDLARLISSPLIARDAQAKGIAALAEKAGFHDLTRRFLGMVARNRRLYRLPAMVDAFNAILAARRGEQVAEVVSARPLTAQQVQSLTDALRTAVGRKVSVDLKVDPALLGGLQVKVGSRLVDASVAGKLRRLQLAMKATA